MSVKRLRISPNFLVIGSNSSILTDKVSSTRQRQRETGPKEKPGEANATPGQKQTLTEASTAY